MIDTTIETRVGRTLTFRDWGDRYQTVYERVIAPTPQPV